MVTLSVDDLIKSLSEKLPKHRFKHSLGVAYTATSLAMVYGVDLKKAEIAGLLHDCAKYLSLEDMIKATERNKIDITSIESNNESLLHSKAGAAVAMEEYGVEDNEILSSIKFHTTGKPGMSMIEKIIFLSDYIEPSRDKQKRLDVIRKTAFEDIDKAVLYTLEDTMEYLNSLGTVVDPMTEETYKYYKENS